MVCYLALSGKHFVAFCSGYNTSALVWNLNKYGTQYCLRSDFSHYMTTFHRQGTLIRLLGTCWISYVCWTAETVTRYQVNNSINTMKNKHYRNSPTMQLLPEQSHNAIENRRNTSKTDNP